MLLVPTKALIVVAAVVWLIAGSSIVYVGVTASPTPWDVGMVALFALVYLLFSALFLRIARKHIKRITSYTESLSFLFKFFDPPSYVILVVMVFFGAAVRMSGFVPGQLIASFYSGLGTALITAAIYYAVAYVALCEELLARQTR
jgi:hypothetical protein